MRVLAIALALCLSGCAGTNFEWQNAKSVHIGSTRDEVLALLGKPYMVKTQATGQETWIWSYSGIEGTKLVSYVLKDGVVTVVPTIL